MNTDETTRQRLHAALKDVVDRELELRVGTELSSGLSDQQLEEFEAIVDKDKEQLARWLYSNSPDFESDPEFQRLEAALPESADPLDLVADYAAVKWLALHRPDYRGKTRESVLEMVSDVIAWADHTISTLKQSIEKSP